MKSPYRHIPTYLLALLLTLLTALPAEAKRRRSSGQAPTPELRSQLSPSEQARFDALYFRAITLHQAGKVDEAFVLYQRALEIDSLSAPLLFALCADYYALKQYPLALQTAQRAAAIDSTNYWYNHEVALMLRALGRKDEAIPVYQRLIRLSPQKSEPLYELADLYLRIDSLNDCVEILDRIEALDGINPNLIRQRFLILQQQGRMEEAFDSYDRLIRRYPYDLSFRIDKGEMLMQAGRFDEAKATYDAAAAIEPDNAYLWVALSNYYSVMGNQTEADTLVEAALMNSKLDVDTKIDILTEYLKTTLRKVAQEKAKAKDTTSIDLPGVDALFQTVATMHPTEPQVYSLHADYLSAIGRDTAAWQQMRFAIDLKPSDSEAWTKYLSLASTVTDSVQFLQLCNEAVEAVPESYVPHLFIGMEYSHYGYYEKAIEAFLSALDKTGSDELPLKSTLWGYIGDTYHQTAVRQLETSRTPPQAGQALVEASQWMEKAYHAYDEALKFNPNNYMVLNNYAYFLSLQKKDLNKAEAMSAKVIKQYPDNATYLDTYAWIYFQQGNYMLARFYQEQALQKSGVQQPSTLLEHYGDILMMGGQAEEAIEQWKKAIDAPDNENADFIRQKINEGKYIEPPLDWR